MVSIARKNMLAGKGRFAFSVAGVAVSVLLLSFVLALYRGWSERLTSYLEEADADLWVVQRGNESFFSPSIIPISSQATIESVAGVEGLTAFRGRTLRLQHDGESYDAYVMGVEALKGEPLGGPTGIKEGAPVSATGQIVVDDVLARIAGIEIGDEVVAGRLPLRVVGISRGGNLGVSILCFVHSLDARALLQDFPFVNYYLVDSAEGQESSVAAGIEATSAGLAVFTSDQFVANSRRVLERTILPVLGVIVVLVFAVGAIVVGLTIYTATMEKEREFGVMKAIGTPNRRLLGVVLEQSLVCCLAGFVIGQLAVLGATRAATLVVPQFVTLVKWQDAVLVFAAALLLSLVAGWLPMRRLMRVDPLTVFKA
ncbi:MAG: ABC transporter permease [Tepidiformaceae bacterium]